MDHFVLDVDELVGVAAAHGAQPQLEAALAARRTSSRPRIICTKADDAPFNIPCALDNQDPRRKTPCDRLG
jgi:hypothetical protein